MKKYKYIFIVSVTKTPKDLINFIPNVKEKVKDCRIVVINSYIDEESLEQIRDVAIRGDCDFISVTNKGYGYGNNCGIEYAMKHYIFEYIIISNPDILIQTFDDSRLRADAITGPVIHTKTGKNQNPHTPFRWRLRERLMYVGYKRRNRFLFLAAVAINRLFRICMLSIFFMKKRQEELRVYAVHGAFLIIPQKIVREFMPIYDEKMFLYAEEDLLANKMKKAKIPHIVTKRMNVKHMEDGCTNEMDVDCNSYASQSFIYYFEHYCRK